MCCIVSFSLILTYSHSFSLLLPHGAAGRAGTKDLTMQYMFYTTIYVYYTNIYIYTIYIGHIPYYAIYVA